MLADFHDILEIVVSHQLIVVFTLNAHIDAVLRAALRVPPAVTRLTVYRRLHIDWLTN